MEILVFVVYLIEWTNDLSTCCEGISLIYNRWLIQTMKLSSNTAWIQMIFLQSGKKRSWILRETLKFVFAIIGGVLQGLFYTIPKVLQDSRVFQLRTAATNASLNPAAAGTDYSRLLQQNTIDVKLSFSFICFILAWDFLCVLIFWLGI